MRESIVRDAAVTQPIIVIMNINDHRPPGVTVNGAERKLGST